MGDELPRADFEATLDDFVDAYVRQARRTPSLRRQFRRATIHTGAICAALSVVVIDAALKRSVDVDILAALVIGGVAGAMCAPGLYEQNLAKRTRKVVIEQYGPRLPMRCEIELRPAGLWLRQDQSEVLVEWDAVQGVEDTPDGIELWLNSGVVVARNRGFATPAARERFLADARARVPVSRRTAVQS